MDDDIREASKSEKEKREEKIKDILKSERAINISEKAIKLNKKPSKHSPLCRNKPKESSIIIR